MSVGQRVQQTTRKGCGCLALAGSGCLALPLLGILLITAVFLTLFNSNSSSSAATGTFSAEALKLVPADYVAAYQVASAAYGVPATFLAAIAQRETQNGHIKDAGVVQPNCSTASPCHVLASSPSDTKALSNSAGAAGPMQIGICCGDGSPTSAVPTQTSSDEFSNGHSWGGEADSVWHGAIHPVAQTGCAANNPGVGEDGNGDGIANIYDIRDAACSSAKRLTGCWDHALEHLWQMAYAYFHGCGHNPPDSARTTDAYTKAVMQFYNQFTDWTVPVSFSGNASALGVAAVQVALRQLGKPYVWGADGPNSFDCSGLTFYAYKQAGFNWTRMTAAGQLQWARAHGAAIPFDRTNPANLQAGDLVFYGSADDPHHVEMYMGNGQMVEAPHTGDVVKVVSFPGDSDAVAAARPALAIH